MADFKVLRGTASILSAATTQTITEGVDYTLEAGQTVNTCFIRIVNCRLTGMGKTSGGGNQNLADFSVSIKDPENILTSITFERDSNTATIRVEWEIVQCLTEGANQIIVRDVGSAATTGNTTTCDGTTVTTISDVNQCCLFITGQRGDDDDLGEWYAALFTSEFVVSGDDYIPRFTRGLATSHVGTVSYAVVEFVGSNWRDVSRQLFTDTGAPGPNWDPSGDTGASFTVTMDTALLDDEKAFMHVQFSTDNNATGTNDGGDCVELTTSLTDFTVRQRTGVGTRTKCVWVMENTQADAGAMVVEHVSFYDGTTTGSEERQWTQTVTDNGDMAAASIMGECASVDGGGTAYPRGAINLRMTADTTVTLTESDMGQERRIAFDVVWWPSEQFGPEWAGYHDHLLKIAQARRQLEQRTRATRAWR